MTLGLLLPLALAFLALTEVVMFTAWRNSGRVSEVAYPLLIGVSLAFPVLIYVILNILVPEWGAIVLW